MNQTHILVAEGESGVLDKITFILESEGFTVHPARTAFAVNSILQDEVIDLAILDILLPDASGFEICRKMKREVRFQNIPVIFITDIIDENNKLNAFKIGADDFLCQPFSMHELVARSKVLLKRIKGNRERFSFQGLDIFFDRHIVEVEEKRVSLSPSEFMVLKVLLEAQGKTIPRETLLEKAWGVESKASLRSVYVAITRLRDKIKPYGNCIRTVTSFGYQWDPDALVATSRMATVFTCLLPCLFNCLISGSFDFIPDLFIASEIV